jgi:histone acetyltransferase 1
VAVNSSEAISLNLTRNDTAIFEEDFGPAFTYALFGEEETIVGYKDLSIRIDFRAHDLRPSVRIKYASKMKPINEQMEQLMDIEGKLKDYLPESAFATEGGAASNGASNGTSSWTPPGELAHSYEVEGRTYQIWRSSLTDPRALEILANMRILVPFFIEGGTIGFLDEPAWSLERWKLFLVYEVDTISKPKDSPSAYQLAGFSTSYRLWVSPSDDVLKMVELSQTSLPPKEPFDPEQASLPTAISPLNLLSRERISQFIILPPYQGQSHGSWLYNAMVSHFRADPLCFEITVEEPNEQFDVLRDMNDLAYLNSQHSAFKSLCLPDKISQADLRRPSYVPDMVPADDLFALRSSAKLAPRQFQRLVEIHLLSTIPALNRTGTHRITRKANSANENDRRYYFWRLMVKERLFIRNKDQLIQVDEAERVPKLEAIMPGVSEEYESRIEGFQKRVRKLGLVEVVEAFCGKPMQQKKVVPRKRKVVEDDEDEDEDVEVGKLSVKKGLTSRAKRVALTPSEDEGPNTLHD